MKKFFLITSACAIIITFSFTGQANAQWDGYGYGSYRDPYNTYGAYNRRSVLVPKTLAWDHRYAEDAPKRFLTPRLVPKTLAWDHRYAEDAVKRFFTPINSYGGYGGYGGYPSPYSYY